MSDMFELHVGVSLGVLRSQGAGGIPGGPGCPPGSILQPARQPPPALALWWPSGPWSRLSSLVMRAALRGSTGWVVSGVGDTPVSVLRRNVSAGGGGPQTACCSGSEYNPDDNVMFFTLFGVVGARLQMCE